MKENQDREREKQIRGKWHSPVNMSVKGVFEALDEMAKATQKKKTNDVYYA